MPRQFQPGELVRTKTREFAHRPVYFVVLDTHPIFDGEVKLRNLHNGALFWTTSRDFKPGKIERLNAHCLTNFMKYQMRGDL